MQGITPKNPQERTAASSVINATIRQNIKIVITIIFTSVCMTFMIVVDPPHSFQRVNREMSLGWHGLARNLGPLVDKISHVSTTWIVKVWMCWETA